MDSRYIVKFRNSSFNNSTVHLHYHGPNTNPALDPYLLPLSLSPPSPSPSPHPPPLILSLCRCCKVSMQW